MHHAVGWTLEQIPGLQNKYRQGFLQSVFSLQLLANSSHTAYCLAESCGYAFRRNAGPRANYYKRLQQLVWLTPWGTIHTYIHTYIHPHTHIHTYTHTYMLACMQRTYTLACIHIHTCMHTYLHTYIHTHRHT